MANATLAHADLRGGVLASFVSGRFMAMSSWIAAIGKLNRQQPIQQSLLAIWGMAVWEKAGHSP